MLFVELSIFTKRVRQLVSDDEYREFQLDLLELPERGVLIRESGGLRKVRWAAQGKGKSGGVRIIYYFDRPRDRIYLLLIYPKSERDTLTDAQRATLRALIEKEVP